MTAEETWFQWAFGLVGAIGVLAVGWIHKRIDKRVPKDVFEEFKKGNDAAHKVTHDGLKEIKSTQIDIYRKLDTKADKQ